MSHESPAVPSPPTAPVPAPAPDPAAAQEAYQRRAARAVGILCFLGALMLLVFQIGGGGRWESFFTLEGFLIGPGWWLLYYWRTGHDPKGYAKALFKPVHVFGSRPSPALPPADPQKPS